MAANRSGLQMETIRNILLAWVLTLPVCRHPRRALFAGGLYVVVHSLVLHTVVGLSIVGGSWSRSSNFRRLASRRG